jgi:predicted transcriptional regulator
MKVTLRTTLDKDLAKRAKKVAQQREISISAVLERALDRYLPLIDEEDKGDNLKEQRRASA